MPAVDSREALSVEFQSHFVQCEGLRLYLGIVTDKNFMSQGDTSLKRWVQGRVSMAVCSSSLIGGGQLQLIFSLMYEQCTSHWWHQNRWFDFT